MFTVNGELVQCEFDEECVTTAEEVCPDYEQTVQSYLDGIALYETSCEQYNDPSTCNWAASQRTLLAQYQAQCSEDRVCEQNRCVAAMKDDCSSDDECLNGYCVNAACQQCGNNDHCAEDHRCDSGECVRTCETDLECPHFHSCENNSCVERGCETDRECIAFTKNALSTCAIDSGKCDIPCHIDADCSDIDDFNFQTCESGSCVHIGCASDEECRLQWGYTNPQTTFNPPASVFCR